MTTKQSPTEGINVEEELSQLREAIENLELFDHENDPDNVITYLGDIETAASRARRAIEGREGR